MQHGKGPGPADGWMLLFALCALLCMIAQLYDIAIYIYIYIYILSYNYKLISILS